MVHLVLAVTIFFALSLALFAECRVQGAHEARNAAPAGWGWRIASKVISKSPVTVSIGSSSHPLD